MQEELRDEMLIKMNGNVEKLVQRSDEHHETLFGDNGVTERLLLVKDRQDKCPARKAVTTDGKQLKLSTIILIVAIGAIVADVLIGIFFNK